MSRFAVYEMSINPPRFAQEVTVDDSGLVDATSQFWSDHPARGIYLLVLE